MAWLIGQTTAAERRELERRGWKLEDPPDGLLGEEETDDNRTVAVFVDNDLFKIMSGPDWDTGEKDAPPAKDYPGQTFLPLAPP